MPSYRDFRPRARFQRTLALSPDNRRLAYADDRAGQFNVVVQPLGGGLGEQVTAFSDNTVRRVAWHPDGQSLVFLADCKGDENTQLYRVRLNGDEPEPLTEMAAVQYTTALGDPFSPDGRRLAYAGNDRVPADQDVLIRDLASGEIRRVYAGGGRVHAGWWSPDGNWLTAAEWIVGNSDHRIYVVPADGSPATRLTPENRIATYWLGPWLPDSSGFLIMSNVGREFTGLAVMDASTGSLTWLDLPDWDVEDVALSADGRTVAWIVNVDGAPLLRARNLVTGQDIAVPELPMGGASNLLVSADGAFAVMLLSTPTRPWNVATVDLTAGADGEVRWLTGSAPIAADVTGFVEPTLIRIPARDGTALPAFLYQTAPDVEPLGVVISIHGGPAYQERPTYLYDGFYQYLLKHGVAILAPNVRGSSGYGKSYVERQYRDWGGIDLDDFADCAAYLVAQPWVAPTRMALFGASYGGFAVLSCLSRLPELDWAAGVDMYGISNLVTLAKSSPPAWRSLVEIMIGDADADEQYLLSRSPVTHADAVRAPLLVLQGANDPRVPRHESDQMVERLQARGVEVRYDVYPDEGHGFTKRENQVKAYSDAADFLISHLRARSPQSR